MMRYRSETTVPISGSSAAGGLASPTGIERPIYHAGALRLQRARKVIELIRDGELQQGHRLGVGPDRLEREPGAARTGSGNLQDHRQRGRQIARRQEADRVGRVARGGVEGAKVER